VIPVRLRRVDPAEADRPPAISRDLTDDAVYRVLGEIGDGHRGAVPGQQRGARAADTSAGTGYDGAALRKATAQDALAGYLAPLIMSSGT